MVLKEDGLNNMIYNEKNILITENDVINLLNRNGVSISKINDLKIIQQAFVHTSYSKKSNIKDIVKPNDCLELFDNNYERLEYLGDKVIKLIISTYLFHRYPNEDEGFMTKLQIKLEDKNNLAYICKELKLSKYFIISKQTELLGGRHLDRLHEDILESFIGGLYTSNGYEPCLYFITYLLENMVDYSDKLYYDNNYKDKLIKFYSMNNWSSPQYTVISEREIGTKHEYVIGVHKNNSYEYIGYGTGQTKKIAEQHAAKMALIKLGQFNEDQYTNEDIFYPE